MQTNTQWEDTNNQNLRNAKRQDQCDNCKRNFTQDQIDKGNYIKICRKVPVMFYRGLGEFQRVYLLITIFRCCDC